MDGVLVRDAPDGDLIAGFGARAAAHDRDGSFPFENFAALQQAGWLNLTASPADGGEGAGLARTVSLVGRIAQGCPSTALVFAMQCTHLKRVAMNANWPEHLRRAVIESAGRSGALINALRVEPGLGTPHRGGLPDTVARRTPDGWAITGHKIYSTGIPALTWLLVWARTDEDAPRTGFWLVPAVSEGVRVVETWDHLGLRASASHDVLLESVAVPADYAVDIRLPKDWARQDPMQVAWNTLTISALYTGVAVAARDWLVTFLQNRVPTSLGAPLATLPRMQEAMGEIEALLTVNRRLIDGAAADYDAGRPLSINDCNLIKTVTAENAIQAVQRGLQLTGNHGLSRANPLERHLRDVLCARIHSPQADSAHIAAGRAMLGV